LLTTESGTGWLKPGMPHASKSTTGQRLYDITMSFVAGSWVKIRRGRMPTSHFYQINQILELIVLTEPKSILDVGVGFGKYGFLAREYLELWDNRQQYKDWQHRIDGVEAFEHYATPLYEYIYDQLHFGDATEVVPRLTQHYDLLLLIDVLEHMDEAAGKEFLAACRKRARNIIISTPKDIGEQGEVFGNIYETHRFQWQRHHLGAFPPVFFLEHDSSLIAYLGEDADRVRRRSHYVREQSGAWHYLPFLKRPYRALKKRFLRR
jgi:hypothetical protein